MKCQTVRDVVFIHANLKLKEKAEDINYAEETVEWSDDDDDI